MQHILLIVDVEDKQTKTGWMPEGKNVMQQYYEMNTADSLFNVDLMKLCFKTINI